MIKTIFLLLTVFLLSSCIQTRSQIQNRGVITQADSPSQGRLTTVPPSGGGVIVPGARSTNSNEINEIQAQLRELIGRIEVLEKNWEVSQNSNETGELKNQFSGKMALYEQALVRLEAQVNQLSGQKTKSTIKSSTPVKKKTLNAFDVGEERFNQKQWKKAILKYQEFREKSPKSKNYAEATYKIAVCFQELGMKKEASAFFNEVVIKYPKSRTAKKAKYRLSKIK